jgi:hypothetical protein
MTTVSEKPLGTTPAAAGAGGPLAAVAATTEASATSTARWRRPRSREIVFRLPALVPLSTRVQLYGNLTLRIDEEALTETRNDTRRAPA